MSNVYIVRAEEVQLISDGVDGWISVPDIKLPAGSWGAYAVPGQPAFHLHLQHNGVEVWSTWHGPHTIGTQTIYFVDIPDDDDQTILAGLRTRLGGAANVAPLIDALRAKPALRAWCKASGLFNPIRNSLGQIVGLHAPLVIAGRSGHDLNGDDPETAQVLSDLE